MRRLACIGLLFLTVGFWAPPALAGKRLALVVGNSQYENVTKLPNPANDASDIADELMKLGFEVVSGIDLTREQFAIVISDFRGMVRSEKADDVVFYYAGHAFNLDGLNQFVPVDAKLKDRKLISYETIRLNDILSQIQVSDTQKTVILLDACRNSPLPPELQDDDVGGGLAQLETNDSTANALLIFATLPKQVTKDGKGRNSPFARALLQNMSRPGESIDEIFPDIRKQIMAETGGTQKPFKQGSPPELFYFNPLGLADGTDVAAKTPDPQDPVADPPADDTGGTVAVPDAPPSGETPADDVTIVAALPPSEAGVIIGTEVDKPDETPPKTGTGTAESTPPVADAGAGAEVAPIPDLSLADSAISTAADPDGLLAAAPRADAALPPGGTSQQVLPTGAAADAVKPEHGTELASNGSALLAAGTQTATIEADQTRSAEEDSIDRSAVVSAGEADTINAGEAAAPELAPESAGRRSVVASLAGDVIAGVEVADDIADPPPRPDPEIPVTEPATPVQQQAIAAPPVEPEPGPAVADGDSALEPEGGTPVEPKPPELIASVDPEDIAIEQPEATPAPEEASPEVIGKIQDALKEAGCFGGKADGKWGNNSQAALEKYLELKDGQSLEPLPSQAVLDQMTAETDSKLVCVAERQKPPKPAAAKPPKQPKPPAAKPPKQPKPPAAKPPKQPKPPVVKPPKPPPRKPGPIVIIGG